MQSVPRGPAQRAPAWEYLLLGAILAGFLTVCGNEIRHGTSFGQDFPFHELVTKEYAAGSTRWFFMDPTSRPFLYSLGSILVRNFGPFWGFVASSGVFALFAATALALLHDSSRRLIRQPAVRLSALALIAFVPVTTVTTVVYAADTLALLPFVLAGWALIRITEAGSSRELVAAALLCAGSLCLGDLSKATFTVMPVAGAVILLAAWRAGWLPARRAALAAAVGLIAPLSFGLWLNHEAKVATAGSPARHTFNWAGTGEMTYASLLGIRSSDRVILQAPVLYTEHREVPAGEVDLVADNSVSYAPLLHLGTFSDVLNFAGNNKVLRRPRPPAESAFSRVSVRVGLPFSIGTLAAVASLSALFLIGWFRPRRFPVPAATVWLVLGLVWYLPLTVILPFVHHVYGWGYWLPRLVLPALWAFLLLGFARFEAVLPERMQRGATAALAAAVIVEGLCAAASVWY